MARRNLDLGPRPSDPVGRILRRASTSRMAVRHIAKAKVGEGRDLFVVDQPFNVVVTKQQHNGSVRWEVAIERGGKLDEGYSYSLPIRHRRSLVQALGIATSLAMALACPQFFIEFEGDVTHAVAMPGDLDIFFNTNDGEGGRITCDLTEILLQRQYSDEDMGAIFSLLMERTNRTEVF